MTTRFKHHGNTIVQTTDSADPGKGLFLAIKAGRVVRVSPAEGMKLHAQKLREMGVTTRDALLSAVPAEHAVIAVKSTKAACLTVLKAAQERIRELVTPLTLNNSEYKAVADMGRIWNGVARLTKALEQDDMSGIEDLEAMGAEMSEDPDDSSSTAPTSDAASRTARPFGNGQSAHDLQKQIDEHYGR